jgi:hypothetical protein
MAPRLVNELASPRMVMSNDATPDVRAQMRACWAFPLGDCSDKLSNEHYITEGVFGQDEVLVDGLAWCKTAPKPVSIRTLARKCLCTHHNSSLSKVDDAAIEAHDVIRECFRLSNVRDSRPPRRWSLKRFEVDGSLLERWLLKTALNVLWGCKQQIGPKVVVAGQPPLELVEVAFGKRRFTGKAGLWCSLMAGEQVTHAERWSIQPLFDSSNRIVVGMNFSLLGLRFLLSLDDTGFKSKVDLKAADGSLERLEPRFHLKRFDFHVGAVPGRNLSHVLTFRWGDSTS